MRVRRIPGPAEAGLLFSIMAVLQLYAGRITLLLPLSDTGRIIFSEIVLISLPPVLMCLVFRFHAGETFRLRLPRLRETGLLLVIAPVASLTAFCAGLLAIIAVRGLFGAVNIQADIGDVMSRGMTVAVLAIGLSPAICEEIMFRGFFQRGLEGLGARKAVILSGVLFGLFHYDFQRFAAQTLLGLVIAYVVYRTGSIVSGMLLHFLHNAGSVLLSGMSGGLGVLGFAGVAGGDVFSAPVFLDYAKQLGVSVDNLIVILSVSCAVLLVCGLFVLVGLLAALRYLTRDIPHPPVRGKAPAGSALMLLPGIALIGLVYTAIALNLAGHPAGAAIFRFLRLAG